MKSKLQRCKTLLPLVALILSLSACTTGEITAVRSIADPLVKAAVSGYAAQYGVPPVATDAILGAVQDDLWGMYTAKVTGQKASTGAANPGVASAVLTAATQQGITSSALPAALQKAATSIN